MTRSLNGLSDIRSFFQQDPTPVWWVCATPYTLLGMDEWVRGFRWVSHADCFDGAHPRVFTPRGRKNAEVFPYETLEAMNAGLLSMPHVQAHIRARGPGRLAMLQFDEEGEQLAKDLGLELILPSAELRRKVDSKTETTRIANRAGVASVPNVLGRVRSWDELQALAGHLGPNLVIQLPFGDSGLTTFFVSGPEDLDDCLKVVAAEAEVKVMKRIRCAQAAIEACTTKAGTIVGPVLTEIVGHPELTPYKGGWAGNEVAPAAFTDAQRKNISERTRAFGDVLNELGYRGYFEIDWLIDLDDGEVYLGEVNPRLTGASPLTNLAAFAHADAPLFLFHLLEYTNIPFELDVDALNARWAHPVHADPWGQLIIKHTSEQPVLLTGAASSGAWQEIGGGQIRWQFMQVHRRTVDDESSAFFLRIPETGTIVRHGDDLGVLVMRGRLMDEKGQLTNRAKRWIEAIRNEFVGIPIE
jgi:biotin carboxylase